MIAVIPDGMAHINAVIDEINIAIDVKCQSFTTAQTSIEHDHHRQMKMMTTVVMDHLTLIIRDGSVSSGAALRRFCVVGFHRINTDVTIINSGIKHCVEQLTAPLDGTLRVSIIVDPYALDVRWAHIADDHVSQAINEDVHLFGVVIVALVAHAMFVYREPLSRVHGHRRARRILLYALGLDQLVGLSGLNGLPLRIAHKLPSMIPAAVSSVSSLFQVLSWHCVPP